ncbi:MAG TPA: hypothetical protein VLE95_07435, partial [Chlamydiales bacterium]|nr:hypothetical protein [Chlamydiales bacterium]
MSVLAIDPKAHWITPEEQLDRLHLPTARTVSALSPPISAVAKMIAQYTGDDPVMHWYTAHSLLGMVSKEIPPLPKEINEIMDSKCPIYGDQTQADGSYLKVKDTHFLALVPKEFGTLNQLQRDILKPYAEREYSDKENPLRFRFTRAAHQAHADAAFPDTHWVLMTKDVLPESRNKSWEEQAALVRELSKESLANYQIPTLQQASVAITADMVATGERLYQQGNDQNGNIS